MKCPKCEGRGYLLSPDRKFLGICDCEKGQLYKKMLTEKIMSNAGIFREYWDKTINSFVRQPDPSHMQFVDKTKSILEQIDKIYNTSFLWIIYGAPGVGKTLAASLILMEAVKKGYTSKYIIWSELLRKIISNEETTGEIKNIDFLTIDELTGDVFDKMKLQIETLDLILKYRYSNKKPTILILKEDYDVFSKKFNVISELAKEENISYVLGKNFRQPER